MGRFNLILFNPETLRSDAIAHAGNPASETPTLDRIARRDGVSFVNAFSQNPVCVPSRCSFMSGWYPHVHGHRTMFNLMSRDEPVLLRRLKDEGYFVWWGGKNDLIPGQNSLKSYCSFRHKVKNDVKPMFGVQDHELDELNPIPEMDRETGKDESEESYSFYVGKLDKGGEDVYYDSDWSAIDGAIDFIKTDPEKPFCIYLSLGFAHPPYAVEDPWYNMIDRDKAPERKPTPDSWRDKPSILKGIYERQNLQNLTEEQWRELRATYLGMVARVDHQFGKIVEVLKEMGMYEDTALFFFGDHGDFTGDYGLVEKTQNTFEDCLVNVPLVFKPPSSVDVEPGVREALVELVDIPATIEDLTNIEPQHTHFGKSFLPVVCGNTQTHKEVVFSEGGRLEGEEHCMELESMASPKSLYWPRLSLQKKQPEHSKAVMVRTQRYKYVRRLYEKDELYDLEKDPEELENRIDDPSLNDVQQKLRDELLTFFLKTGDVVPHETDERWGNQRW
ncbi:arylsulfatase [candidate division MSBL1 archaeon SCGC-AAA259E19]|uniref:Arylsulfatase n=1 Tax=candidate division MSBL1 archaeon SCGC-AAA259E19 TaxID=1698264 RepID=A0A133UKU4_9EURY|nr:arylsulfatase [candidate division MSBL1 archaeon SCGC-AAA259E19]